MQRELREISKKLGLRGWRFDIEQGDRFYLSKFDPVNNDDEYRFYFFLTNEGPQVVRRVVIKKYKYKETISTKNTYFKQAEAILNTYFEKQKQIHTA